MRGVRLKWMVTRPQSSAWGAIFCLLLFAYYIRSMVAGMVVWSSYAETVSCLWGLIAFCLLFQPTNYSLITYYLYFERVDLTWLDLTLLESIRVDSARLDLIHPLVTDQIASRSVLSSLNHWMKRAHRTWLHLTHLPLPTWFFLEGDYGALVFLLPNIPFDPPPISFFYSSFVPHLSVLFQAPNADDLYISKRLWTRRNEL